MQKILLSLVITGAVAGTAIIATNAFFSDSETSSGNTFQAGNLNLQIESQCSYNNKVSFDCGSWALKDLGIADKFFNFSDVKPGDLGENTITFKVADNNAWMCGNLAVTQTSKLADYLQIFWWVDADGDNIYDRSEKKLYSEEPLSLSNWLAAGQTIPNTPTNNLQLTVADASWNWIQDAVYAPIPGNKEQHLGVGWCFGELSYDENAPYGFKCDGSFQDQSDARATKIVADLKFDIQQSRNNTTFRCPESVNMDRKLLTPIAEAAL